MRLYLLCLFGAFLWLVPEAHAQPCTTLGQTPPTAFPVCGTLTFTQQSVPLCGSQTIPVNCFDGALYQDRNPFWYKFTCYVGGTLGFVITPQVLSDDYDWQLFDITNRNPNDVFTDPSLFVAANWSFMSGTTGASATGIGMLGCAASTFTFCQMPTLVAGHQYLLLVSHFTNTQSGYQLSFGGGTASITDPNIPAIQSATPNCDGTRIVVRFNKALKCNSLTATGSDFSISPSAAIVSAIGHGCASGFTIDSVTLTLGAPLAPGTYTLSAANGTDGNTLTDNCDLSIAVGNNVSFSILPQPALPMGTALPLNTCNPVSLTLNFAEPIACSSLATNGSDFIITGPSAVTVTGATATCNSNGETNTVTLQFAAPILAPGSYQVQVTTGNDGNTLLGNCNRQVNAGASADFSILPRPPLAMGTINATSCSPISVTLNFTDTILCSSLAANGSDFILSGPSPVTISAATATCNANGETNSITLQFAAPITVSGNYVVSIATGSDGNTLLGKCFRQLPAGENASFNIPLVAPSLMTGIPALACSPVSIRINLDGPVQCSSITANGSDFIITGPSPATITSAGATCNNGLSTVIDIQLSSPLVVGGTYQLQLVQGNDGNTLLSDCNRLTPPSSLNFTVTDTVSALFSFQVQSDCSTNNFLFTHPGGNGINTWTWTVNGNPAGNLPALTQVFPASGTQIVGLTVSNGTCTASSTQIFDLNNEVIVDFSLPDFICPEDSAQFINLSSGPVDNWSWNFGNGQTSTSQLPEAQGYPVTGRESFYQVTLTASNNNGCSDSKTKMLRVLGTCRIAVPTGFTPNNDGLNDYLYPLNAFQAGDLDFRVYNRWGEMVFHSTDWQKKWDGKIKGVLQPSGVFAWTLRYVDKSSGERISLKGTTVLIR